MDRLARAAGLEAVGAFNLGQRDDFRISDCGLRRPGPFQLYVDTAPLVVEILSPGDETFAKLPSFLKYAAGTAD